MTVLSIASRNNLARQQRVVQSAALHLFLRAGPGIESAAQLYAQVMTGPLRIKFAVVRNLDGARRREQAAQGRERFSGQRLFGA